MILRFLKWLVPGLKLKRWLSLALFGMLAGNVGVAALTFSYYIHINRGIHDTQMLAWGIILVVVGGALLLIGSRRVVKTIVTVIAPERQVGLLESFYEMRQKRRGPKIVTIGGGTGLSTLLRGLKHHTEHLTAIVAMADDGGSSGRLRNELGMLPPGDIRNCLTALAGEEDLLTDLFRYRFDKGELRGHSFGNLFLAAMSAVTGDLQKAIQHSSKVLAVQGEVLPATLDPLVLVARLRDGRIIQGESTISGIPDPIAQVWLDPHEPKALPEAIKAIQEAEAIVIGPGSLYTSIIPNLLIPEIRKTLLESKAPKIYVCNVMTQPGETDDFLASDHVRVLKSYGNLFDYVLVNRQPPNRLLDVYRDNDQFPVIADDGLLRLKVKVLQADLLDETDRVRHNPQALALSIMDWLGKTKAL